MRLHLDTILKKLHVYAFTDLGIKSSCDYQFVNFSIAKYAMDGPGSFCVVNNR